MAEKIGVISNSNGIPVLFASGESLAEAWENSLVSLYKYGYKNAPTQYDKKGDPPSIDATMEWVIENPLSEPLYHRCFPGEFPKDLEEYRQEVMEGIKDNRCRDPTNPFDTKWEYTYHERLFDYKVPLSKIAVNMAELPPVVKEAMGRNFNIKSLLDQPWVRVFDRKINKYEIIEGEPRVIGSEIEKTISINQIKACIDSLATTPYSRRVQAITWKPWEDLVAYDPACLQSLWFRIIDGKLNMNVRFRSWDAYKAAFMNMYALINLQIEVANQISERTNNKISVGRCDCHGDSFHIYGSYLKEFENVFLKSLEKRTFSQRTWTREDAAPLIEIAREEIANKLLKERSNY